MKQFSEDKVTNYGAKKQDLISVISIKLPTFALK